MSLTLRSIKGRRPRGRGLATAQQVSRQRKISRSVIARGASSGSEKLPVPFNVVLVPGALSEAVRPRENLRIATQEVSARFIALRIHDRVRLHEPTFPLSGEHVPLRVQPHQLLDSLAGLLHTALVGSSGRETYAAPVGNDFGGVAVEEGGSRVLAGLALARG
jgi:hypothetical protein